ncbi:hypothetical protein KAW50_03565 [candidate division WOR-3 bacterium]|nr:hypothetical protein [candidate division WOR-3 bacterium]
MLKKLELVKVVWVDVCGNSGKWRTMEEVKKWINEDFLIETVGWLIFKDSECLVLASSYYEKNQEWNDLNKIPLAYIKRIWKLKPK